MLTWPTSMLKRWPTTFVLRFKKCLSVRQTLTVFQMKTVAQVLRR